MVVYYDSLKKITTQNNQGEFYLTDIFHYIPKERTGTVVTNDELEVTGVNSIGQLGELENELRRRKQIEC
jgi:bifunctional UDP-N-acetylglucosamine pyrophosphorylase/glucosamine-1-phosphate N-acetyltransferase